jgi:hypothetical protein
MSGKVTLKYDPDDAGYDRKTSGAKATWTVKAGHAQMLKGKLAN